MPYPALINSHGDDSGTARAGRRVFSPGVGDVRFALCGVVVSGVYHVRMNKSLDAGLTWVEIDTASEPTIEPAVGLVEFDAIIDPSDANVIIVAWVAPRASSISGVVTYYGEYCINTFDMVAGVWGTRSTGGPGAEHSLAAAYAVEDFAGIYFNVCKDPADGSVWLSYLTLVDASTADPIGGVGSVMMRPSIIQLDSGGTWGTPILMMAEPTVLANCRPNGICIGDSSRVHVMATQYAMTDIAPFGFQPINDWLSVFHQSQLSGVLGSVQLVDDQIYASGQFEVTASPLAKRTASGSTEILFGYGRTPYATPPGSRNQDYVDAKVARSISVADPTWTIETIPGISNVGNDDVEFLWCAPVTDGSRLVAYSNFSDGNSNVWLSEYSGGAWYTARYVFAASLDSGIYGDVGYLNLVNGAASVGVVLNAARSGPAYYYELALQSPARNYIF